MRKFQHRRERDARAAGPGEARRARDGQEERRRIRGLGISGGAAGKADVHGDSGIRPRGAGSPPGAERGVHLQAAGRNVARGGAPAGRQPAVRRLFRPYRRRDMVLAVSRLESPHHGPLRPVRQAHRQAQDGFKVPSRYERQQATLSAARTFSPRNSRAFRFMIAALRRTALLALTLLAAGCANFSALSPGDSALTIEARVGPPGTVWTNADGSEVWEYPQGFYALQTFMVAFDPDHAVREVRQVLNEAYFSKLQPG